MGGGGGRKRWEVLDGSDEERHHNQHDRRQVETGSERKRDNSKSQLTNKKQSLEKSSSSEKGKEEVKTSPLVGKLIPPIAEGDQNRMILTITDKERSIPPALPPINLRLAFMIVINPEAPDHHPFYNFPYSEVA